MEDPEPPATAIDLEVVSRDLDDVEWVLQCLQSGEERRCERCAAAAADDGSLPLRPALSACAGSDLVGDRAAGRIE